MAPRFLALTVEPGVDCKVSMPPCSALEIKNAALAPAEKSFTGKGKQQQRCTLECDLATHHFVLCSLPPGGHQQASLGTVVTNDPDAPAWLFLKARGPRTFHVLGSIQVDESQQRAAKKRRSPASRAPSNVFSAAASPSPPADAKKGFAAYDDDWPTAGDIAVSTTTTTKLSTTSRAARAELSSSGQRKPNASLLSNSSSERASDDIIEVLLPDGDDVLEYPMSEVPSDEGSDDFVQWMTDRTSAGTRRKGQGHGQQEYGAAVKAVKAVEEQEEAKKGGSRTQRRRAAQKRARGVEDWGGGEEEGGGVGAAEEPEAAPEPPKRNMHWRSQKKAKGKKK